MCADLGKGGLVGLGGRAAPMWLHAGAGARWAGAGRVDRVTRRLDEAGGVLPSGCSVLDGPAGCPGGPPVARVASGGCPLLHLAEV